MEYSVQLLQRSRNHPCYTLLKWVVEETTLLAEDAVLHMHNLSGLEEVLSQDEQTWPTVSNEMHWSARRDVQSRREH